MPVSEELIILLTNGVFLFCAYVAISMVLKRENTRLNKIIEAQDKISRSPFNLDYTLELIVERLQILTKASGAVVELIEGDELIYRKAGGQIKNFNGYRMKIRNSLSGYCIGAGEVIYCHDTENDERVNKEATRTINIRSMVVAPLFYEGNVIGVLKVSSSEPRAFTKRDAQTLLLMASLIGPAIAHQQDYEDKQKLLTERSFMALHDGLTNLPNRRLFMEMLQAATLRAQRSGKPMALMYMDLDGFKKINDELGHQAGDHVLVEFAVRLRSVMRKTDFVARMGGDEFTIIAENLSNIETDLAIIANKVISVMQEPFKVAGMEIKLTTSVGVSTSANGQYPIEELIKQADDKMYLAKQYGKNRFVI